MNGVFDKFKVVSNGTETVYGLGFPYGTTTTAAGTQTKTVTCSGFQLYTGVMVVVKFGNDNTVAGAKLNINSTGAKAVYHNGAAVTEYDIKAGNTFLLRYNGTQYDILGSVTSQDSVILELPMTLQSSGWTSTSPYTYTVTDARITGAVGVEVEFNDGAENLDLPFIEYEKGTGSVVFTASEVPSVNIPITLKLIQAKTEAYTGLEADMVASDAVANANNVEEALSTLNDQIATLEKHELGVNVVVSTTDYTTLSDGFFVITIGGSVERFVYGYVNGKAMISIRGASGETGYPCIGIFVKKGMRIHVSESISGQSGALFYPLA